MADCIVYRIIGNALPPRHDAEETFRNLDFILAREPELPGCEKRWLLNGFVDRRLEERCIARIEASGQAYERIPFDPAPYATAFYDASGMPAEYNPMGPHGHEPRPALAVEWILRHKSLALINLNAARNRAIELGRREARWVLPLDGWSFITLPAWTAFRQAVRRHHEALYVMLPLARLSDNSLLETPERLPAPDDEPQIAFRNDAPDRFDERRRYGNQNKVDLLRRLEFPGPWGRWVLAVWDTMAPLPVEAPGRFVIASCIYRLSSGAPSEVEESADTRHLARFQGVARLVSRIDRDLLVQAHGRAGREHAVLHAGRRTPVPEMLSRLRTLADDLAAGPETQPRNGDREALWHALRQVAVFSAAGIHGGEAAHLARAAGIMRAWLIDPATAIAPAAGASDAGTAGWDTLRDLWLLPALCRSLVLAGALPHRERDALRSWAGTLHEALRDSASGRAAFSAQDGGGTWVHLLRLSLGLFLGRYRNASVDLSMATLRLAVQCAPDGAQPLALAGDRPLHDSLWNLTAWVLIAGLGRANGVDLWRYRGVDGQSICRMLAFAIALRGDASEARDNPAHWSAWIDSLCLLAPEYAADRDLLPRLATVPVEALADSPVRGLPPQWPILLGKP